MQNASSVDWPAAIHAALGAAAIRQVAYVPDAGHARLIQLVHADSAMRAVVLTTEEEAAGLALGAWLGGERSALLMQSSGVGNCVNQFAMLQACRCPFLTLITMRGEWGEFNPWQVPMGSKTQATLELCGFTVHRVVHAEEAGASVEAAARLAYGSGIPVAVLLSQQLIGSKAFVAGTPE